MAADAADDLYGQIEWPFGEEFLGGRHFLARMEKRPFASLSTTGGRYQFFAHTDRWDPEDVWTQVLFSPAGVRAMDLPVIFHRRESTMGHGLETLDAALSAIAEHLAAGQPIEWDEADVEEEDETADED
ncbi:MAG: hypothetical protein U0556_16920 [Dehalococcoidia bacterium]